MVVAVWVIGEPSTATVTALVDVFSQISEIGLCRQVEHVVSVRRDSAVYFSHGYPAAICEERTDRRRCKPYYRDMRFMAASPPIAGLAVSALGRLTISYILGKPHLLTLEEQKIGKGH